MATKSSDPLFGPYVPIFDPHGRFLGVDPSQLYLGSMHAASFVVDPKHLLFTLARYHFVARMITGRQHVLEVGCGDGTGARLVAPVVEHLCGIDVNEQENYPGNFYPWDIRKGPPEFACKWDAVFALDVLEHFKPEDTHIVLSNMRADLLLTGVMIIGMPSFESQPYASPNSKREHVNCMTEAELRDIMGDHFHNVFIFGMNDATLHTGFGPMCHYRLALCTNKR